MKGYQGDIFSEAPDWKPLFMLLFVSDISLSSQSDKI